MSAAALSKTRGRRSKRTVRAAVEDDDVALDEIAPPTDETVWEVLRKPSAKLSLSEELLKYLEAEVRTAMTGRVFALSGPGNVWEGKPGPDGEPQYRTIMAVGGERMTFEGWYVGKKKGLILQFRPMTEFAGMKVEGFLEFGLNADLTKKRVLHDVDSRESVGEIVASLPCVQHTAIELALNFETHRREAEERIRAAELARRQEEHGELWGMF